MRFVEYICVYPQRVVYLQYRNSQNDNIMETQVITKVLNKVNNQPVEYSLGFKRLSSLPVRVRRNVNLACILKGESNDNSMKDHFNKMTENEFITWMKNA